MIEKVLNGFRMKLDPSLGGLSSTLAKVDDREQCFMWILNKEAGGEVAVDVGANIGYTTLPLCAACDRVIAVEPDPRSIGLLRENIALNDFQVEVRECALSNACEERSFTLAKKPNQSGFCDKIQGTSHTVRTMLFDDLGVVPSFVKMDIEGHEVEVLQGAMKSLQAANPCKILIEVHPQFYWGDAFEVVLRDLVEMGFRFKYVVSAGVPVPDLFKERGYTPIKGAPMAHGKTRGIYTRAVFDCVDPEDAIQWSAYSHMQDRPWGKPSPKIVRSILLVKGE